MHAHKNLCLWVYSSFIQNYQNFGSNQDCSQILYCLSHQASPFYNSFIQNCQNFENNQDVLQCHFSQVQLFATPWTVAHQVPLSMVFFRQEYCSGLLCPPPGDLPDPGMNLHLQCVLHYRWVLYYWATGEAHLSVGKWINYL